MNVELETQHLQRAATRAFGRVSVITTEIDGYRLNRCRAENKPWVG
jgi:hypothetical protein